MEKLFLQFEMTSFSVILDLKEKQSITLKYICLGTYGKTFSQFG